jgi:hypothetical protein
MYQIAVIDLQIGLEYIYQPFPFHGPPQFTQIGIFGLKYRYHLATLALVTVLVSCSYIPRYWLRLANSIRELRVFDMYLKCNNHLKVIFSQNGVPGQPDNFVVEPSSVLGMLG